MRPSLPASLECPCCLWRFVTALTAVRRLVEHFGCEALCEGTGVVDVAGGRGMLSFELCQMRGIPCSVVDPRLADGVTGRRLTRAQAQFVQEAADKGDTLLQPQLFPALLEPALWEASTAASSDQRGGQLVQGVRQDENTATCTVMGSGGAKMGQNNVGENADVDGSSSSGDKDGASGSPPPLSDVETHGSLRQVLRGASILVGMHPDQATEPIVACALALGKPFAIVPCCVFPTIFQQRRLYGFDLQSIADIALRQYVEALVQCCERAGGSATMECLGQAHRPVDFGLPRETRLRET